jgi:hypothetical protein
MIRTSLYLPDALHQHLLVLSQRKGQSFSELARVLFCQAIEQGESSHILGTYEALDQMEGIGENDITDASMTVDQTLYGGNGAWQGDRGETGLWTLAPQKVSDDQ